MVLEEVVVAGDAHSRQRKEGMLGCSSVTRPPV